MLSGDDKAVVQSCKNVINRNLSNLLKVGVLRYHEKEFDLFLNDALDILQMIRRYLFNAFIGIQTLLYLI